MRRYEITSIDSNLRVNDDYQFYVSYTLFEEGLAIKYLSAPIYAKDELEAFMYFKRKMEQ